MQLSIQALPTNSASVKEFYKNLTRDFCRCERIPRGILHKALVRGDLQTLLFFDGDKEVGYIVCHTIDSLAMSRVEYLAVQPHCRAGGYGTAIMHAFRDYIDGRGILLEAEDPASAKNVESRALRERRLRFYERLGFHILPDVRMKMFGARLLFLTDVSGLTIADYNKFVKDMYRKILGGKFFTVFVGAEQRKKNTSI